MPYTSAFFAKQLSVNFLDRSDERSSATIYVAEDVTIVDGDDNGVIDDADVVAWIAALVAVTDGNIAGYGTKETLRTLTTTGAGQREQKYLVTYKDLTTGKIYDVEIPTRDTSINPPLHTDLYDLSVAPWPNFVTQFDNMARSPDGNTVSVVTVRLIGKNN